MKLGSSVGRVVRDDQWLSVICEVHRRKVSDDIWDAVNQRIFLRPILMRLKHVVIRSMGLDFSRLL